MDALILEFCFLRPRHY